MDTHDSSDKSNDNNNENSDNNHLVSDAGDEHLDVYLGRAGFLAWIIMIVLVDLMTVTMILMMMIMTVITMLKIIPITITLLAMQEMNILTSICVGQDFWQGASAHLRHLAASLSAPLSDRVVGLASEKSFSTPHFDCKGNNSMYNEFV